MILKNIKILGRSLLIILAIKMGYSLIFLAAMNISFLNLSESLDSNISLIDRYGLNLALFLIIIIGPIIEETVFRGFLSNTKTIIGITLIFSTYYLALLTFNILITDYGFKKYFIVFLFILVPSGLIWISRQKITDAVNSYKKMFIIISITLFTIIHALNYEVDFWNWKNVLSLFVLIIPYPFIGYVFTNIRLKCGLIWSIFLHIINNGLILIPLLLGTVKKF